MNRSRKSQFFLVVAVYLEKNHWNYSMLISKRTTKSLAQINSYQEFKKAGLQNFVHQVKKEPIEISELSYRTRQFVMKQEDYVRGYILSSRRAHKCPKRYSSSRVLQEIISDWRYYIDILE